jgi:hypothetical protein
VAAAVCIPPQFSKFTSSKKYKGEVGFVQSPQFRQIGHKISAEVLSPQEASSESITGWLGPRKFEI